MKKLFTLLLIGFLLITPMSVSAATTTTSDGLEVTITTDKDSYAVGEDILVTVNLRNTGVYEITNVSIATLLPDDLQLVDGALTAAGISLKPGKAYDAIVTAKTTAPVIPPVNPNEPVNPPVDNDEPVNPPVDNDEPVDPPVDNDESVDPPVDNDESVDPPVDTEEPVDPEKPAESSPETSDRTTTMWLVILVLSAVGFVILACNKKAVRMLSIFLCVAIMSVIPYAGVLADEAAPITVEKVITVGETEYTISTTVTYKVNPSEETKRKVDELLSTKHKLTYNDDGSFRVLILADCHMNVKSDKVTDVKEVKDRIKLLVDKENPDLVIFTGDNTISATSETYLRADIDAIVGYVEEKKIPWCHVYGNHDDEYGAISKANQQRIYESYEYCVSKTGPSDIFGVGNYVLGVYKQDGSLGSVIYCMDSGTYASSGGYDYIKPNQIAWYKQTSELLQEYNCGKVVEGMMAFHIPMYENRLAYDNRNNKDIVSEWNGERNEDICSSNSDKSDMFETMLQRGDIKAVVTGHDHKNSYMFNYYGIKLCSSPNISDLTYHDNLVQGSRVFDLNLATLDNIPTHVTLLESLYNSYETMKDNTVMEFADEAIRNVAITAWNGAALTGKATVSINPNAGVNGTEAIQVTRDCRHNTEFILNISNPGKLGNNKYLAVWADFTNMEFRKACFGLNTPNGYYRSDDADYVTDFYYLPDGATSLAQVQTLHLGEDGCFGNGDTNSQNMEGMKGYFVFPLEYFLKDTTKLTKDTPITGLYFYLAVKDNAKYFNVPIFYDDARLIVDLNNLLG